MPEQEQWYSNKDLFEQINELKYEMKETRNLIKQYNGLREKLGDVQEKVKKVEGKVDKIEAESSGKNKVFEGIRKWGGWICTLISLAILIFATIGGR